MVYNLNSSTTAITVITPTKIGSASAHRGLFLRLRFGVCAGTRCSNQRADAGSSKATPASKTKRSTTATSAKPRSMPMLDVASTAKPAIAVAADAKIAGPALR